MLAGIQHQGGEGVTGLVQRSRSQTSFLQTRFPDMEVHRHGVDVLVVLVEENVIGFSEGLSMGMQ